MIYNFNKAAVNSKVLSSEINKFNYKVDMVEMNETSSNTLITVTTSIDLTAQELSDLSLLITNHDANNAVTQFEQDKARFKKRADVKNDIISEMAAGNLERVRAGTWSSADLVGLTQDVELKDLLDDVNTLSFEIAYSKIDALTNSLLTQAIKDDWKALLLGHFYL